MAIPNSPRFQDEAPHHLTLRVLNLYDVGPSVTRVTGAVEEVHRGPCQPGDTVVFDLAVTEGGAPFGAVHMQRKNLHQAEHLEAYLWGEQPPFLTTRAGAEFISVKR